MLSALLAPLLFAAVSGVVLTLDLGQSEMVSSPNVEAPAAAQPGRVDVLLDRHDCWTDAPPADMVGVIPGHVVVTTGKGRVVYSAEQVGAAFDQVSFDHPELGWGAGVDHSIKVWGFCR